MDISNAMTQQLLVWMLLTLLLAWMILFLCLALRPEKNQKVEVDGEGLASAPSRPVPVAAGQSRLRKVSLVQKAPVVATSRERSGKVLAEQSIHYK